MSDTMTTLVQRTDLESVEVILNMLKTMTCEQQKDLLVFLRGVAFGRMLAGGQAPQC